ncbi:unnamed protein product, partial [Meganyctiphanes norvegica]
STDITEQFNETKEIFIDDLETRFFLHCIQLLGVFAVMAESITDFVDQCCTFLYEFREAFSCPPLRHYVEETLRDIIGVITKHYRLDTLDVKDFAFRLLYHISVSAGSLEVCNKTCNLPRLLLSRQVQGFSRASQRSLLIPLLTPIRLNIQFKNTEYIPYDSDDDTDNSQENGNYSSNDSDG